eukprot:s1448_g17.t1
MRLCRARCRFTEVPPCFFPARLGNLHPAVPKWNTALRHCSFVCVTSQELFQRRLQLPFPEASRLELKARKNSFGTFHLRTDDL